MTTPSAARHSAPRNAVAIFCGQCATWVLAAASLALLPRYLGAGDIGLSSIGGTFGAVAATVGSLGMPTLITLEAARDRQHAAEILGTAIWLNVGLGLAAGAIAMGIAISLGYGHEALFVIALSCVSVPLSLITSLIVALIQGLELMTWNAVLDVGNKILSLILILIVIVGDFGLNGYLVGSLALTAVGMTLQLLVARQLLTFDFLNFSAQAARRLVVQSIPFLVVTISFVLYTSTDVLLLSRLASEESVGIYSAPMRLFGAMLFIPVTLSTVMFPKLAAAGGSPGGQMAAMANLTLKISITTSIAMALGAASLSDGLLVSVLGKSFEGSGPVMLVLAIALVPIGVSVVAGKMAFAANRQNAMSWIGLGAFVAKAALGVALIPLFDRWFGNAALGAAAGLVLVEFGMVAVMLRFLPDGAFDHESASYYRRVGLAAGAGAVVLALVYPVSGLAAGAIATLAYLAVLGGLRVYRLTELVEFARARGFRRAAGATP